jgi:hypothetical protein
MADLVVSSEDLLIIETDGSAATILEANAGGSTGPQGPTGAQGPAGSSLVWRGNWTSANSFSPLDVVHSDIASGGNGKAYICIQAHTNKQPMTETSYWQVIVERAPGGLCLGPWESSRILGFTAPSTMTLFDENIKPADSYTIDWRKKNGSSVSLPVTLAAGDVYEVSISNPSGRVYYSASVR